jgi:putative acetyltransferase
MACIQSESLRQNAREEYTKEQLDCLAPPDPDADTIPDAEFVEGSCRPIVAEKDGTVVGWGSIHLSENTLAATFVDPDHTGEGIGRTLVEQLENIAEKKM